MSVFANDVEKSQAQLAADLLHSFLECSDEVQEGIRDMLKIIKDPNTDKDDLEMTLMTLADALFPNPHNGLLGLDLEESERMGAIHSPETKAVLEEMDREESDFSDRLNRLMKTRGLSQEALAKVVGVGQPAISNMLRRQCRPQRATVQRFADALGVAPEELWPN